MTSMGIITATQWQDPRYVYKDGVMFHQIVRKVGIYCINFKLRGRISEKKLMWICEAECYELICVGIFKISLPGAELIKNPTSWRFSSKFWKPGLNENCSGEDQCTYHSLVLLLGIMKVVANFHRKMTYGMIFKRRKILCLNRKTQTNQSFSRVPIIRDCTFWIMPPESQWTGNHSVSKKFRHLSLISDIVSKMQCISCLDFLSIGVFQSKLMTL